MLEALSSRSRHSLPLTGAAVGLVACLALVGVGLAAPADAAVTTVPLGTTSPFAVLSGQGITNTGATVIRGDIGSYPNGAIDDTTIVQTGTNYGNTDVSKNAKNALITAYDAAAAAPDGATPPEAAPPDLGGQTLTAGAYNRAGIMQLTGTVTLDAENDPNAVFIFQAGSGLTIAPSAVVALTRGAQACNVFWQVGSSATINTAARFKGTVLALTSIFVKTGARIEGRLLARNGEVTLESNTITRPGCVVAKDSDVVTRATPAPTAVPSVSSSSDSPVATAGSPTTGSGDTTNDSEDTTSGESGGSTSGDRSGTTGQSTATGQTTGLPSTGGPSGLLLPVGLATTAAGAAVVVMARKRPRGAHRG